MKNLANCKPSEFLRQTNKIKKSVERWLTDTDILNIRARQAVLIQADRDAPVEEKKRIGEENNKRTAKQTRENLSDMLDAILDKHPDETLELLALLCFVEPSEVDDYTMDEYLTAISELLDSKAVVDFFTSLARWALPSISGQ